MSAGSQRRSASVRASPGSLEPPRRCFEWVAPGAQRLALVSARSSTARAGAGYGRGRLDHAIDQESGALQQWPLTGVRALDPPAFETAGGVFQAWRSGDATARNTVPYHPCLAPTSREVFQWAEPERVAPCWFDEESSIEDGGITMASSRSWNDQQAHVPSARQHHRLDAAIARIGGHPGLHASRFDIIPRAPAGDARQSCFSTRNRRSKR